MINRELKINFLEGQIPKGLDQFTVDNMLSFLNTQLAERLHQNILIQANVLLVSTKQNYIQALSLQGETIILDTTDFAVKLVELGSEPYDMKPGLLASPKVKVGKNGEKYISVPLDKFRGGKYNWRDRETGKFSVGSNPGGDKEFRVVSTKSDPNSWMHPGHHGFHIIDREIERLDISDLVDETLSNFF